MTHSQVIVHEIRSKGVPNIIAASQQRASLFLREVVEGALKKNVRVREFEIMECVNVVML